MKYTYTFDQLRDVTPEQVNLRFMDLDWTNRHGGVNPAKSCICGTTSIDPRAIPGDP